MNRLAVKLGDEKINRSSYKCLQVFLHAPQASALPGCATVRNLSNYSLSLCITEENVKSPLFFGVNRSEQFGTQRNALLAVKLGYSPNLHLTSPFVRSNYIIAHNFLHSIQTSLNTGRGALHHGKSHRN